MTARIYRKKTQGSVTYKWFIEAEEKTHGPFANKAAAVEYAQNKLGIPAKWLT